MISTTTHRAEYVSRMAIPPCRTPCASHHAIQSLTARVPSLVTNAVMQVTNDHVRGVSKEDLPTTVRMAFARRPNIFMMRLLRPCDQS